MQFCKLQLSSFCKLQFFLFDKIHRSHFAKSSQAFFTKYSFTGLQIIVLLPSQNSLFLAQIRAFLVSQSTIFLILRIQFLLETLQFVINNYMITITETLSRTRWQIAVLGHFLQITISRKTLQILKKNYIIFRDRNLQK